MTRSLLSCALLLAAFVVQAATPSHSTADGAGAGCPPAQNQAPAALEPGAESRPVATPEAEAAAPVSGSTAGESSSVVRHRHGVRWHSFLPGMFK
jgi:hypothetical protein